MEEAEVTKEEIRVDWKKLLDSKKANTEATLRNLEIATNSCQPLAIEIATRLATQIASLRDSASTANSLDDISNEEWEKVLNYTFMRENDLTVLTSRFSDKCKCQITK